MDYELLLQMFSSTYPAKRRRNRKKDFTLYKNVKIKRSPRIQCATQGCPYRFIEIYLEIEKGIKRTVCPICKPYDHYSPNWKKSDW